MSSETRIQTKSTQDELLRVELFRSDLGTFTTMSWEPDENLTQDEWARAIAGFDIGRKAFQFYIGDGLNWGEAKWGEMYQDAMEATGMAYQTIANWKWVAKKVPVENRRIELEWEHHKLVASRSVEEQREWLDLAEISGWTVNELRVAISGGKVTLLGNIEPMNRGKRKLMTEFFSLSFADKNTVDKWVESLTREEINRITDGEVQEALVRLAAIIDILQLY